MSTQGIEQDHFFVTYHSTGTGDSISPTILTFSAMNPKMSFFSESTGTTFTVGRIWHSVYPEIFFSSIDII